MSITARAVRLACLSVIAAIACLIIASPINAQGGVPIPAPAGTTWSIIAGYNTRTHSDADQGDPHAIDIVRTDASTNWTPVLSPVDGEVTWRGSECVTIRDANGYAHLLCHISPHHRVQRGLQVRVGDDLGQVYPKGLAQNSNVAHIHYAIHHTRGGGYLGRSIPFTGSYAIEGRELHWSEGYNLHVGLTFTSTNTRGWTAPTVTTPADDPPAATDPPPTEDERVSTPNDTAPTAWTIPADAPVGGWRTIGVERNTSVAGLYAQLQAPLVELVIHDARLGAYHRFDPDDPASAGVAVRSLKRGQAVWALVQSDQRWLPAPLEAPRQVTIRLSRGPNLVAWQGPERSVADALGNVAHLSHAYQYDPYSGAWRFWSPDAPAVLNTLAALNSGDALYINVRAASTWTQLP